MRKIDEIILDILSDIYPLSMDVREIADLCGYDVVLVEKTMVELMKSGKVAYDERDRYKLKA
ncbi:MAG: hypothetical protein ACE5PM_02130 [Candidatus Hydrothermarchaeales archaeon]